MGLFDKRPKERLEISNGQVLERFNPLPEDGAAPAVTLPQGITSISKNAFKGTPVASVSFSESVRSIGEHAFERCMNLKTVKLPYSVREIGKSAFAICSGLREIEFSDNIRIIPQQCFYCCNSLERVVVPEGVRMIDAGAFSDCRNLTEVTLPASMKIIKASAFGNCTRLKTIFTHSDLTAFEEFPDGAIAGCGHVEIINLMARRTVGPFNLRGSILEYYNPQDNATKIAPPEGVTQIGENAFANCEQIEEIILPGSVHNINRAAFERCRGLQKITIPEGVKHIGTGAFFDCRSLTSIELPSSIDRIEADAFRACKALTEVKFQSTPYVSDTAFTGTPVESTWRSLLDAYRRSVQNASPAPAAPAIAPEPAPAPSPAQEPLPTPELVAAPKPVAAPEPSAADCLIMQNGIVTACRNLPQSGELTVPEGITQIGNSAFKNQSSLKAIRLPSTLQRIGASAFSGCTALQEIKLPDSLRSIDDNAFERTGLKRIIIPEGVNRISYMTFTGCASLTEVVLPMSVLQIFGFAFKDCTSLLKVQMSNKTLMEASAFHGCTRCQLERVHYAAPAEIPEEKDWYAVESGVLTSYEPCAADHRSLTLPETVRSIGDRAFLEWKTFSSIRFPDGLQSIGLFAFYDTNLTELHFPEGLQSIGPNAFAGCRRLKKVWLPSGLRSIGENAFADCPSLEEIWFSSQPTVGSAAFKNCPKLKMRRSEAPAAPVPAPAPAPVAAYELTEERKAALAMLVSALEPVVEQRRQQEAERAAALQREAEERLRHEEEERIRREEEERIRREEEERIRREEEERIRREEEERIRREEEERIRREEEERIRREEEEAKKKMPPNATPDDAIRIYIAYQTQESEEYLALNFRQAARPLLNRNADEIRIIFQSHLIGTAANKRLLQNLAERAGNMALMKEIGKM